MSLYIEDKTNPMPVVGDKVTIKLRGLLNESGAVYDLSTVTKFYCTIKDALTDLDAAALKQINSSTNATQFITTYASTGNLDVILLPADTVLLSPDVTYYIDIKAIWSATDIRSLAYDTIEFAERVTRATS